MNEWSTLKKMIWLKGSGFTKGSGGGSYITLVGDIVRFMASRSAPFRKLQIALEPIQDLHGYDSPWPAGGGKNKASLTNPVLTTNTQQSIATFNNIGTFNIVLSVDLVDVNYTTGSAAIFNLLADNGNDYRIGTQLYRVSDNAGINTLARPVTGRFYCKWENVVDPTEIRAYFMSDSYGKWSGQMKNVQVEFGTSATDFAPYSNICPISGRTSATVTRTGKNLLPTEAQDVSNWSNGTVQTGYYKYYRCNLPSGTYYVHSPHTVPFNNTLYMRTVVYKADGTYTREYMYHALDTGENRDIDPIVIPQGGYLQLEEYGNDGNAFVNNLWITKSADAPYEPYVGTSLSLTWSDHGTIYGGTLDVLTGVLTVTMAMVDLGTWDWAKGNANNDGTGYIFRHGISGMPLNTNAISSHFKRVVTPSAWEALHLNEFCIPAAYVCVCADYPDASAFKTAVSGVQLCYELATPTVITLTPQAINSLVGENNVWDDGTVTVEVKGEAIT